MKEALGLVACALLVACKGTAVPMAPEKSPHFEPVSSRLQLGGTVYTYIDIDGDAERAASFALSLLRNVPTPPRKDLTRPLNAQGVVRALGLSEVHAIGLSSYKKSSLYHNRAFVYHTGPKVGLLKVFGGAPTTPALGGIAPPGADLVWEQQLNLAVLVEIVRALGKGGVGASPAEIDRLLSRNPFGLNTTLGELLEQLDTTAGLIIEVDEERVLRIPGETFWFPYTDFLFQIDGLGSLVDAIADRAAYDPFIRADETDEWVIIRPGIRLPPPWHAYEPSVIKDRASGRMYIVSRPEYLTTCLSLAENVTTTDSYKRAFEGLPMATNGLLFMSPQLTREMHAMLDRSMNERGATTATIALRYLLPEAGAPTGWVAANRTDGILFTSNSSSSHKTTLITLGYAALLPAIAVLGSSRLAPRGDDTPPFP